MRRTFTPLIGLLALAAVVSVAPAARPFQETLPENTTVFISARSAPELRAKVKNHWVHDLWQEPSVKQFLDKFVQYVKEEITKAEGEAGVKFDEVWSLLKGQVSMGIALGEDPKPPEILVLIDVGSEGERAMQLIATLREAAAKKENEPQPTAVEEEFEGTKLIHMHKPAAEGGDAQGEPDVTYGVAGDVFVMGRPAAAVKRTIGFLKTAPAAPLSKTAAYSSLLNKVSPTSDIVAYVNLAEIITLALKQAEVKAPARPGPKAAQIVAALGLDGLVSAGLGIELDAQYTTTRIFIRNNGEPRGLVKLIMPEPGALHDASAAPAEAAGFAAFRFDANAMWDEVEKGLAVAAPQALAMLNMKLGELSKQAGEPFDLRKDVLSVFGSRVSMYSFYTKPYQLGTSQQIVFTMDISSRNAFEQMMAKFRKIAPQALAMLQSRDYLGHKMYVMSMPKPPNTPPGAGAAPKMPTPAFAVTENALILSNQASAVEAHLRRLGKQVPSLGKRAEFRAGMASLPSDNRVMISFQDPGPQVEYMYAVFKTGLLAPMLERKKADPDVAKFMELFDFSNPPPVEDITKHLVPSTGCAVVDSGGLLVTSRMPAQPLAK